MLLIALRQLIRRPRHFFALGLGILIVTSLTSSIFIISTNVGILLYEDSTKDLMYDFLGHTPNPKVYRNATDEISSVEYVKNVFPLIMLRIKSSLFTNNDERVTSSVFNNFLAFEDTLISAYSGFELISGHFPSAFEIGIPLSYAQRYNLSIGSELELVYFSFQRLPNRTILEFQENVSLKVSMIFDVKGNFKTLILSQDILFSEFFILSFKVALLVYEKYFSISRIYLEGASAVCKFLISLERESLINVWNIGLSLENLERIRYEIQDRVNKYNVIVIDLLSSRIKKLSAWSDFSKIIVALFSAPIMLFGILSLFSTATLMLDTTRKEIGIIKVRGAENKQLIRLSIYQSLLVGFLMGIVGAVLGSVISFYLLSEVTKAWHLATVSFSRSMQYFYEYLVFSSITGLILGFLATYLPVKKVTNKIPSEFLSELVISEEQFRPAYEKITWAIFFLGIYKILSQIAGVSALMFFGTSSGDFVQSTLYMSIYFIDNLFLGYLGPIFLIVGATKLASDKLSSFVDLLKYVPISKFEYRQYSITVIKRKLHRYAQIVLILGIAIGFTFSSGVFTGSLQNTVQTTLKIQYGTDINMRIRPTDIAIIHNITDIQGIEMATVMLYTSDVKNGLFIMIGIKPLEYYNAVKAFLNDTTLSSEHLLHLLWLLDENPTLAIINDLANQTYTIFNGTKIYIPVHVRGREYKFYNLTVIGSFSMLLGMMSQSYWFLEKPVIVFNLDYLELNNITRTYNWAVRVLVKVVKGYDETLLMQEINATFADSIIEISSYKAGLASYFYNPYLISPFFFLSIEYIYMNIIAVFGLATIVYTSLKERQKEFGILIVRGADRSQLISILGSELYILFLSASIIGIITGILSGQSYANFFSNLLPLRINIQIIFSLSLLYYLLVLVLIFTLLLLAFGIWLSKLKVNEILREF